MNKTSKKMDQDLEKFATRVIQGWSKLYPVSDADAEKFKAHIKSARHFLDHIEGKSVPPKKAHQKLAQKPNAGPRPRIGVKPPRIRRVSKKIKKKPV